MGTAALCTTIHVALPSGPFKCQNHTKNAKKGRGATLGFPCLNTNDSHVHLTLLTHMIEHKVIIFRPCVLGQGSIGRRKDRQLVGQEWWRHWTLLEQLLELQKSMKIPIIGAQGRAHFCGIATFIHSVHHSGWVEFSRNSWKYNSRSSRLYFLPALTTPWSASWCYQLAGDCLPVCRRSVICLPVAVCIRVTSFLCLLLCLYPSLLCPSVFVSVSARIRLCLYPSVFVSVCNFCILLCMKPSLCRHLLVSVSVCIRLACTRLCLCGISIFVNPSKVG